MYWSEFWPLEQYQTKFTHATSVASVVGDNGTVCLECVEKGLRETKHVTWVLPVLGHVTL